MDDINRFGLRSLAAINALVTGNQNHYLQALIVLYSAIDTLAWVSISSGDVTRSTFCSWVEKYMQPQVRLNCSPEDLYAARCGLLHSSAAESNLSRQGRASELWYVTSPHSKNKLKAYCSKIGANAKVLYFTDLVAAFADAVNAFSEKLASDPAFHEAANARMKRWLQFLPTSSIEK